VLEQFIEPVDQMHKPQVIHLAVPTRALKSRRTTNHDWDSARFQIIRHDLRLSLEFSPSALQ
jgi:hypothetical protein